MKTSPIYQIEIAGRLDDYWGEWFGGLSLSHSPEGNALLTGPVVDQPALHGLLNKVRDLGLTLLAVRQVGAAGSDSLKTADGRNSVSVIAQLPDFQEE